MAVDRVDPGHIFGRLDGIEVGDVHHHGLIVRAHQHAIQMPIRIGIDFLVRHSGRDVDEVARPGLGDLFQPSPQRIWTLPLVTQITFSSAP